MKLIDLLVKELPKRGGWPEGAIKIHQDYDGETWAWLNNGSTERLFTLDQVAVNASKFNKKETCENMVTSDQYEAALTASEGWIEWGGGKCPVDSDAIVEVKCRWHNQHQYNNDRAGDFSWSHNGGRCDIIAYRLHDQGINHRANDDRLEQDLNECIGQGVAAEWDGEGLPPAGCECEARYRTDNAEWAFFRCVGVDCGVAFGWSGKEAVTLGVDSYEFRPLRTEAEMAREKLAASLHIAAGASSIELNGIGPLYFKLADAIISGSVFGTTFKAGK